MSAHLPRPVAPTAVVQASLSDGRWSMSTLRGQQPVFLSTRTGRGYKVKRLLRCATFLHLEGGSPNATLVVLVLLVVVISSLKMPIGFLPVRSATKRNFAYTFVLTLPTDLPSQIFKLFSN